MLKGQVRRGEFTHPLTPHRAALAQLKKLRDNTPKIDHKEREIIRYKVEIDGDADFIKYFGASHFGPRTTKTTKDPETVHQPCCLKAQQGRAMPLHYLQRPL